MSLVSNFQYHGLPRFGYGWENPNHAGAALILLLPFCWATYTCAQLRYNNARLGYFALGIETVLTLMLCGTLSRGAVIGWAAALASFCLILRLQLGHSAAIRRFATQRTIVFVGLLVLSGLATRMGDAIAADGATANRLIVWSGVLRLVAAAPWHGWGGSASGLAYMQWSQSPDSVLVYGGIVNSYMEAAVDYGLPFLAAGLALCLYPLFLGVRYCARRTSSPSVLLAGGAPALVGLLVAGIFSTLWTNQPLLLLIAAVLMLTAYSAIMQADFRSLLTSALLATGTSALAVIALFGASTQLARQDPWRMERHPDGSLLFQRNGNARSSKSITLLVDSVTLGTFYGKAIRRALPLLPLSVSNLTVFPPGFSDHATLVSVAADHGTRYLFGGRAPEISSSGTDIVLCPTKPFLAEKNFRRLYLAEFDEIGFAEAWRAEASRRGISIQTLPRCGQDIRSQLSEVLLRSQ